MELHVHHRYATRQRIAARRLRQNPDQPAIQTLNQLVEPEKQSPLTSTELSPVTKYLLGIREHPILDTATPEAAALMLEKQQPKIMANCHATWMSSLWIYYHQPIEHHPYFYRDLLEVAERTTWTGTPFVPAHRFELPDGSAFVIYGSQISSAVHRERIDLIADEYLDAAHQSQRRINKATRSKTGRRGAIPLVPHPAYAPAQDGILNHQAALPMNFDRCWCRFEHEPEANPNGVQ